MKDRAATTGELQANRKDVSYPVFDLPEALKIATAVKELGGTRSTVAKSVLAEHLKLPESSASFFQRVGAAKAYDVIEGHGTYALSEHGKKYFYPTSEKEKSLAALEFLTNPTAFAKIVEQFDGEKLPRVELIGNIIHKEAGVPISWKDRVVNIFVRSAQHLGIIDQGGILRYNAAKHSDSGNNHPGENESSEPPEKQLPPNDQTAGQITRYKRVAGNLNVAPKIWTFTDDNKVVMVETPRDLTMQEWEMLNQYVQFIKPKEKTE